MNFRASTSRIQAAAFTLVELVVVLVIMSVLAGVIAPRLLAGASRSAEAEVYKVAELVSAAGRRDTLTSQQIAIDFDGAMFRLMVLRMPSAADAARGIAPEWVRDSMTMPAELKDARLVSVTADGAEVDIKKFRIEFTQNGQRPSVLIVLTQNDGRSSWTVVLPSGAFRARVIAREDRFADQEVTSVDLDQAGKAEEPW